MIASPNLDRNKNGRRHRRGGVAAVEGAIVLNVFLLLLFGMLDLGLLVLDYNTLSEAARKLARVAIVRGQMAAPKLPMWGPATITGNAADNTEYGNYLQKELATFNLGSVTYTITWPDGTNRPDDHVQVTVNYQYQPIIPYLLGTSAIPIRAATTMLVAH